MYSISYVTPQGILSQMEKSKTKISFYHAFIPVVAFVVDSCCRCWCRCIAVAAAVVAVALSPAVRLRTASVAAAAALLGRGRCLGDGRCCDCG